MSFSSSRPAVLYLTLTAATIALGLATRSHPAWFPTVMAQYGGDTLWAVMVYWIVAAVWSQGPVARIAAVSLGIAYLVEVGQLYHAPWIDTIRSTRLGALALGNGFLWSDIVCYTVGVAGAAIIDHIIRDQFQRHSQR